MVNDRILCVIVVSVYNVNLLACFLFKFSELCGNSLVLRDIVSAVCGKIARCKNELTIGIFGTLFQKLVDNDFKLLRLY